MPTVHRTVTIPAREVARGDVIPLDARGARRALYVQRIYPTPAGVVLAGWSRGQSASLDLPGGLRIEIERAEWREADYSDPDGPDAEAARERDAEAGASLAGERRAARAEHPMAAAADADALREVPPS